MDQNSQPIPKVILAEILNNCHLLQRMVCQLNSLDLNLLLDVLNIGVDVEFESHPDVDIAQSTERQSRLIDVNVTLLDRVDHVFTTVLQILLK